MWPCLQGWAFWNVFWRNMNRLLHRTNVLSRNMIKDLASEVSVMEPKPWPCKYPASLTSAPQVTFQCTQHLLGCWCPSLLPRQPAMETGSTATLEEVRLSQWVEPTGQSSLQLDIECGVDTSGLSAPASPTWGATTFLLLLVLGVMKWWMGWAIRNHKV